MGNTPSSENDNSNKQQDSEESQSQGNKILGYALTIIVLSLFIGVLVFVFRELKKDFVEANRSRGINDIPLSNNHPLMNIDFLLQRNNIKNFN